MIDRLLSSLYSAFDKDPHALVALRAQHPDGFSWSVTDRVLTATTESDQPIGTYDLQQTTLSALADSLAADGCTIVYENPDIGHLKAATLLSGASRQSLDNGDSLRAFDSILWSILDTYGLEVDTAAVQVLEAIDQVYLDRADDEYLDLWGTYFGVPRPSGMGDVAYRAFIVEEVTRPRNNALAIELAIQRILGKQVEIREPWALMHRLDESTMSGTHHLPNGYYSYFLIHPVARSAIDWQHSLAVIHRNRPAGIEVYTPSIEWPGVSITTSEIGILAYMERTTAPDVWSRSCDPLDVMRLDDYIITKNYPGTQTRLRSSATYTNWSVGGWGSHPWETAGGGLNTESPINANRRVAKASVCLSDGAALGDENCIFGVLAVQTSASVPVSTLSDFLALSDNEEVRTTNQFDLVIIRSNSSDVVESLSDTAVASGARLHSFSGWVTNGSGYAATSTMARTWMNLAVDGGWGGGWSASTWLTIVPSSINGTIYFEQTSTPL